VVLALAGVWLYRGRTVPPKPPAAAPALPATPDSTQTDANVEIAFWNSISTSDDPRVFREYLAKYPNGRFASLAKLKLATPAKAAGAPAPPPGPARIPEPTPGDARLSPRDGLRYVWIPAGSFQMGCSTGDTECEPAESPRHLVKLTKGFWMGQTEVTVEAWSRFAKATIREMPPEPVDGKLPQNPGWAQRQFPMENISWSESKSYCAWAGGALPTEAQWEYAARAGTTESRYGPVDEIAWYTYNSGNQPIDLQGVAPGQYQARIEQNANRVHAVATKRPNAWGLYDMLGNVNEWVSDWSNDRYYQESPEADPAGAETGKLHTWRGGSYYRPSAVMRASARGLGFADAPGTRTGCRCALAQIPSAPKP
jgi:formylglycine-generating enzyme required for sulfatase activity